MCISESRLFFGVLVPALDLIVAARAWPRRKVLSVVFGSFIQAREQGRLAVLEPTNSAILRVPTEVWTLIETHAAAALFKDEEHEFVERLHARATVDGECVYRAGAQEGQPTLVGHEAPTLTLPDIETCETCELALREASGAPGLMEDHEEDIDRLLGAFDLALVHYRGFSDTGDPLMDVWAAAFVGLPGRCTVSAQVKHGVGDWTNAVERIDPSFFVLPPDAQDRFRRLLGTCRVRHKVRYPEIAHWAGPHEGAGTACVEESDAVPARWHLWGSVSDC